MNTPTYEDYNKWLFAHNAINLTDEDLTLARVAELLGVSRKRARELSRIEGFPARYVGRREIKLCVVSRQALRYWLYRHPAGIRWRQMRKKYGRQGDLEV